MHAILCRILPHKPDRKRVWNDGQDFRCPCRRCGEPMIRDFNGWRTFNAALDLKPGSPPRDARPDSR